MNHNRTFTDHSEFSHLSKIIGAVSHSSDETSQCVARSRGSRMSRQDASNISPFTNPPSEHLHIKRDFILTSNSFQGLTLQSKLSYKRGREEKPSVL